MKNQITNLIWSLIFLLMTNMFAQNPQWINYTNDNNITNAIIPDFQVNENAGPNGANQGSPSIFTDDNGNLVITWIDGRNGEEDIYAQRYACDGSALGTNFRFNVDHGNASWLQEGFSIDGSDNFVITWTEQNLNHGDLDVFAQRFASDGSQLGGKFKVNDDYGIELQRKSSISVAGNGDFVIAWSEDRRNGEPDVYAQRFASDGTALGSNFKVNDETGGTWFSYSGPPPPSIASCTSGNFIITWTHSTNEDTVDIYAQLFTSDGTALGTNIIVNEDEGVIGYGIGCPAVCTDGSGNIIITWSDERNGEMDIYAQRYRNDGTKLGTNFKVNDDQGSSYQSNPTIYSDKHGDFMITWVDDRGENPAIYAQHYSSDGTAVGSNFKVNDSQGIAQVPHWNKSNPAISVDDSGRYVIVWTDVRNGDNDICAQRYANNGTAVGSNFKINDDMESAAQSSSSISTDISGNFVLIWRDERNGEYDIYAQRCSSDGSFLGSNFKINDDTGTVLWDCHSLSTDRNGNFIVTWTDSRNGENDIYAQRYASDGSALGTNFKVNDDQGSASQWEPAVSVQDDGNFVITWRDHRDHDGIFAQRYSSDGSTLGTNFRVTDDGAIHGGHAPAISTDRNGNFVITWEDCRNNWTMDIYAQRYSNDGSPLGTNFRVNDLHGSPYWNASPSISTDGIGNFVITWTDERNNLIPDIYAQRYSSDGSPLGTNFRVTDEQGNVHQEMPSISADSSGNFVITWKDERNGGRDIYAQRYTSDGSAFGDNFIVTNTIEEYQSEPDVKLWNGRIYNTWKDNRAGGTGYDIWANVLDWDNPVGISDKELLQVPSAFSLSQNYPNPFNPSTTIEFNLPKTSQVTLKIFNVLGEEVTTLLSASLLSGFYKYEWDASNLASGVYLYRLQARNYVETRKMVLMK